MAGDQAPVGSDGPAPKRPIGAPVRGSRVHVVVLGGTRGIGRALARRFAERGDRVFLLGRDMADLERSARDIEIRANRTTQVGFAHCDLSDPDTFIPAMDAAASALSTVETVVVTAGDFVTQTTLVLTIERTRHLLTVHFT